MAPNPESSRTADGGRDEQTQPSPVGLRSHNVSGQDLAGRRGEGVGDDDGAGAYGAVSIWQIMGVACMKGGRDGWETASAVLVVV